MSDEKPEAHTLLNGDFVSAIVYERLRADNERLRDELRQSSIDHTRAEVERLRGLLRLALESHNKMLLTDPPQDAWKFNRVEEKIREALQEPPR